MSATRPELPMAPAGCTLTDSALLEQLARYRKLGAATERITHRELRLEVCFDPSVDDGLVGETVTIERGCCSFLTLDYDPSKRRLSITVDGSERLGALVALESALRAPASSPRPGRDSA